RYTLRPTARGTLSPTTTAPWPRINAPGFAARVFAKARPSSASLTSRSVPLRTSRISKFGRPSPNFEIRDVRKGTDLLVKDAELGRALAKTLAAKPGALMRGHGAVVVGESVPRAVGRSVYL